MAVQAPVSNEITHSPSILFKPYHRRQHVGPEKTPSCLCHGSTLIFSLLLPLGLSNGH